MNLAGIGSLLEGGAALAGGLSGLFGKKKKGPSLEKQINMQHKFTRDNFRFVVDGAKAAGIHPLVAMGASTGGGMPFVDSGDSASAGDAIGSALGGIGDALNNFYRQDADERDIDAQRREQRSARLYNQMRDTVLDSVAARQEARSNKSADIQDEYTKALIEEARSRTMMNNARAMAVGAAPPSGALIEPMSGDRLHRGVGSDAQQFSDRYGDIAGEGFGLANLIEDYSALPLGRSLGRMSGYGAAGPAVRRWTSGY